MISCPACCGQTRLNLAIAHQATELKRFCMDYILKHSSELDLDSLSSEPVLLLEITKELMSRQKMVG
jgi:hypothetical protein